MIWSLLWDEFKARLQGKEETTGSLPSGDRPRSRLQPSRVMSYLLVECRSLAEENFAFPLAVGEELVASAVPLNMEVNCWLVRCTQPF